MNIEKRKIFIVNFFYLCIWGLTAYAAFKYGLFILMPFVMGLTIAYALKTPIDFISKKVPIGRTAVAAIMVILFYSTIGVLLVLIGLKLFSVVKQIFYYLPSIYTLNIEPTITGLFLKLEETARGFDISFVEGNQELPKQIAQSIGDTIAKLSSNTLGALSSLATSIPQFLASVLFTIVSTFIIAIDYYRIRGFVLKQLSTKSKSLLFEIKDYIFGTLLKYVKSYAMIMSITFCELLLGFSILGIKKAAILALLIAMFDVLPILGTGGIMIPWVALEAARGNYKLSVALSVIYLVVTIVRNIVEPNIIGEQVGLHPLATLMSIVVGIRLFGPLGLFILPITVVILKNLNDSGKINIIKK